MADLLKVSGVAVVVSGVVGLVGIWFVRRFEQGRLSPYRALSLRTLVIGALLVVTVLALTAIVELATRLGPAT